MCGVCVYIYEAQLICTYIHEHNIMVTSLRCSQHHCSGIHSQILLADVPVKTLSVESKM